MSKYDDLAAAAERGELQGIPGTEKKGAEAADSGRRALMSATGTKTPEAAVRAAGRRGRPRLGTDAQSSVLRARVPRELKERFDAIARESGKTPSDVVRAALSEYAARH